jgi:hypothetical protein
MTGPTVLTLEPLDFNVLGNTLRLQLRGAPCRGRAVTKVDYPASFQATSIDLGLQALREALTGVTGPKLVFAHSQGAQVCSRWLREHAADPDAPPPSELSFLLIGNPLRKYGGYIVGRPEVGGRTGLPTPNDTPYAVTDLKLQYDGWADWPGDTASLPAKWNARTGQNKRHCYGYLSADPADPTRLVHRENTTSYVMIPARPTVALLSQTVIEKSYARPER